MQLKANQIEVIDDKTAEILRRKTPAERLSIGFSLWHSTAQLLPSLIKSLHPEWSKAKINREVVKRLSHGTV
jgi:high-affinity nickel permease